jgi:TetR/AcrR family transcriptional regulator
MTTPSQTRRRRARSPGRPRVQAEEDVRSALLDAATKLFLKHGFERVSARQIAAAAGTTPAMIHYYFDNKLGLFRAMLERAITPVRQLLSGAAAAESAALEPAALVGLHMRMVAANPWIPTFIVNEVFAERGKFRSTFIREIASRQLPLLVQLLEQARASGRLRKDVDTRLAALSLLSLCMFPFVSRAVTGPVLGLKLEGEELERLIAHTVRLFMNGVGNRPASGAQPRSELAAEQER